MAFHGRLGARALAKAIDAPSDSFVITVTMNLRQRELETWGVHVRAGAARGPGPLTGSWQVQWPSSGACQRRPTEAAGDRHDRHGRGRACDAAATCTSVESHWHESERILQLSELGCRRGSGRERPLRRPEQRANLRCGTAECGRTYIRAPARTHRDRDLVPLAGRLGC